MVYICILIILFKNNPEYTKYIFNNILICFVFDEVELYVTDKVNLDSPLIIPFMLHIV